MKSNMKRILISVLIAAICLSGCASGTGNTTFSSDSSVSSESPSSKQMDETMKAAFSGTIWVRITQEEAARIMMEESGFLIVDVRRQDEYESGHIPGAICVPNESIGTDDIPELPDKDQTLLVYCRSGRRSKEAAQKLADLGYSDVREFGGIIDWTGETVTGIEPGEIRQATAEASEESIETESGQENEVTEMIMSITAGDHVITAVLYDNAAGRALWDKLPLTLPMMNLYGREMCYRFGAGGLPEDEAADTGYEIGDISYWPPAGSLVILYKQNGEVFEQQPIGHTDDDISFFDGMPDTDVTFDKAGQ